ncbi:MAG TPA: DUF177 domain-containing protein [Candidatus Methylomirabilis sp.]|jgi:uncharacterized protein
MLVELSQIPVEGLQVSFRDAIRLGEEAGAARDACSVEADFRLTKTGVGVAARGLFRATVDLACSRCLEPFALTIAEPFEVQYLPSQELGEEEAELSGAELDVVPLAEDRIDVDALLRENILLSLPVQPVCREACRGLCPRCGASLNAGPCACPPERPDPRLQALAKLRSPRPSEG